MRKCKQKPNKYRLIIKKMPILDIRLRNSSSSVDPLLQKFRALPATPKKGNSNIKETQKTRLPTCREKARHWEAVLDLQPAMIVKRSANAGVIVDSVVEVGVLRNSVAHFIKFTIEAPLHAVAYGLQVSGHCLPDPPGSLYLTYTLPPSPHSAVHKDFCIRLRDRVRCSQGIFNFFVRIRFLALFRPSIPSSAREVRMTPKGVFPSVCKGKLLYTIV